MPPRFDTRAVSAGEDPDDHAHGDAVSPIHLATTFQQDELGATEGRFTYTRNGNPTRRALEKRLAALEGGEHALALASGMGAIGSTLFGLLEPGDHVVAFNYLYGGTRKLFDEHLEPAYGIEVSYVDATRTEAVAGALREDTAMIWVESPTNPLLKCCDLRAIGDLAAEREATFVVDNTFASPAIQRPLDLGADVVIHSTTKYLNGHTDSLGGAVVTDDTGIAERVRFAQEYATGAVLSPFDSYLVLRGTKTLPARMDRHQRNASAIAAFLAEHPSVRTVHYPGLETHPQHALASEQMDGYGGMLSFEIDGGEDAAARMLAELEHIRMAVSLGGVESLVAHVPTMTHYYLDAETRRSMDITDSLIRLSVGIEDRRDLIADLERGLDRL